MAAPQQRIVERMKEGRRVVEERLRQFVRFRPGRAMHDDGGSFLLQQISRVERRRLRHDHRHRDVEEATGIGDGKPGIAAGGGNKAALAVTLIFLAGCPDAAQLERARGLKRLEFEPDTLACKKTKPAGPEERGVQVERHRRVLSCSTYRFPPWEMVSAEISSQSAAPSS